MGGQQNVDIADTLPWQPFFGFLHMGVHIGTDWQIRLKRPCAAVMRPYVKLV